MDPGYILSHCSFRLRNFPGSFFKKGAPTSGLFLKHLASSVL